MMRGQFKVAKRNECNDHWPSGV